MNQLAVAIVSGGMDSVTLAYMLKHEGYDLFILSFDYRQRHRRELLYAVNCANNLESHHEVVDLAPISGLLSGSALTSPEIRVPEGHYAAETMKATVVPNRNAILLSIAYGAAVSRGAVLVALGIHGGDHFVYPDCRPEFFEAFDDMEKLANKGFGDPSLHLYAPFLYKTKADIVRIGHDLNVPYDQTWSCYKGGVIHCGRCGTCCERRAAFIEAGVPDLTLYAASLDETLALIHTHEQEHASKE